VADVENKAGKFISPTAASASAAIEAYSAELQKDVRTAIVDPPATAADAYPISGLTYLLVPITPKDANKGAATKAFVQYTITTGQASTEELHYSKLPPSLQQIDQSLLRQLK